ncbi:hypothetical protein J6590_051253 [Homalodisca vitripennis]|nr:hypothetical protein J6590_051253 [Homalodisca vitripennis]
MEYVRLPRVTVSDYLTNTNVRQLFASRANIVSERRWRRLFFEDASTLQFAKHSPPNTLNVRTNIHELFGQTCSTKGSCRVTGPFDAWVLNGLETAGHRGVVSVVLWVTQRSLPADRTNCPWSAGCWTLDADTRSIVGTHTPSHSRRAQMFTPMGAAVGTVAKQTSVIQRAVTECGGGGKPTQWGRVLADVSSDKSTHLSYCQHVT